jgi:hypothetical protein
MLNDFLEVPGGAIRVCHIDRIYALNGSLYAAVSSGTGVYIGKVPAGRDPNSEAEALYYRLKHS